LFSAKKLARRLVDRVQIASSRGNTGFPIGLQPIATKITMIKRIIATVFVNTIKEGEMHSIADIRDVGNGSCFKRSSLWASRDGTQHTL
jgi:hypothetical protein